jgi:5'-3' exonuclease
MAIDQFSTYNKVYEKYKEYFTSEVDNSNYRGKIANLLLFDGKPNYFKIIQTEALLESSEEEDTPVVEKKPTKQQKTETAPKKVVPAKKPAKQESSSEESDEEAEPDTLTPQIPILLDLLDEFGIPMVGVDDYEADDVMATYAHTHSWPTRIVTGDRDLFQLVDDKRDIKVAYLAKGISAHDLVDLNFISQKYSIPGDRYAMFATFRGDASDGLPGVKGIGEKGAALISTHFESIADAIAAAQNGDERLPAALARKIVAGMDYLAIAPTVVNCARDVPLPEIDLGMPKAPADLSKIYQIKEKYSLGASVDRLISALKW